MLRSHGLILSCALIGAVLGGCSEKDAARQGDASDGPHDSDHEDDESGDGDDNGDGDDSGDGDAHGDGDGDGSSSGDRGDDEDDRDASTPEIVPDYGDAGTIDESTATTRKLANPPSYMGTTNAGTLCDKSYRTMGYEPDDDSGERCPLFLYFVGTTFGASDEGSQYIRRAPHKITEAMARRGFVALSVEYDNGLSLQFMNKMKCMFGNDDASLIARTCALPNVDCDLGIATWGHSQGALVAHSASLLESRIRAVWATGYGGNSGFPLPYDRLRVVNGENDISTNSSVDSLNKATNRSGSECPNDGRDSCLRSDGSGWILVRKSSSALTNADHCWFNKRNCAESKETLEPKWIDEDSTAPFALESNADWVAATLRRESH